MFLFSSWWCTCKGLLMSCHLCIYKSEYWTTLLSHWSHIQDLIYFIACNLSKLLNYTCISFPAFQQILLEYDTRVHTYLEAAAVWGSFIFAQTSVACLGLISSLLCIHMYILAHYDSLAVCFDAKVLLYYELNSFWWMGHYDTVHIL